MAIAGEINTQGFGFERINEINYHKIKTELLPMIRNEGRFDLDSVKERVSSFLKERMVPTGNEVKFLENFAAGQYLPSLLFEDNEIIKRIESHPMALWRIQNINKN